MQYDFGRPAARACIKGEGEIRGVVQFYPRKDGTLLTADIRGVPTSGSAFFALHIHEGADCGGVDFANTGSHFDMGENPHPYHTGDLPPLLSCNGKAFLAVLTDRFRVRDVTGKTVIIHSRPDDFRTQPSGDAGRKIACGVIRPC